MMITRVGAPETLATIPPSGSSAGRVSPRGPRDLSGDQPRATPAREVVERPLHEHEQSVLEADEVHDVHEEPEKPGRIAREPERAELGNRGGPTDHGQIAP